MGVNNNIENDFKLYHLKKITKQRSKQYFQTLSIVSGKSLSFRTKSRFYLKIEDT